MSSRGPAILSCGLLSLTIGATAAFVASARNDRVRQVREREFQHLVGGLGTGPAVDLSGCGFSFDARLSRSCQFDEGPIPGGVYFCPEHGCSIFACSSLHPHSVEHEPGHALLP